MIGWSIYRLGLPQSHCILSSCGWWEFSEGPLAQPKQQQVLFGLCKQTVKESMNLEMVHTIMFLTHWGLVTPYGDEIWVSIGSGYGLLPGGTKPLPESVLINHQWGHVAFTWGQFHRKCSKYLSLIWVWKWLIQHSSHRPAHSSQGPMS